MTEGWRTATLGELTEQRPICYGILKPGKRQSTGVPLVRISDIGKNYVDVSDIYLITSNLSNEFRRSILKGDEILLSIQGTIGRVAICPPHLKGANVSRTIAVIEPNERIDRGFLRYWLLSMNGSFPVGGATRDSLNIGDIRNLVAPLPPLSEQQRIVAILDESFGGLATATTNAERNLANARELFDSYLNSVFTQEGERWREVSLSDVCAISSKLVDPREAKFIDLPHLGAGNMESKTGELADIKTAREERLKSGKFLFDKTMVLYSKIRPYLMKACRPDFEVLCSADVYPLSPDPAQLDRNFLFHLLMSKDFTDFAVAGSDRAGMPKVNRDYLFRYRVRLPGLEEQQRLAAKLDAISAKTIRLEAFYERRLADITDLKQSILHKAFSGGLTSPPSSAIKEAAE